MEDNTELLEKYIEEGKLPLKGELFSRKAKIAEKLRLHREESRRITVSRQRKRGGERSAALYWGIVAMFIVLLGIGGYYFSEEKLVTETTAMDYELPDGSKVKLMGNSSLSYNRVTWFWERKLQLLGKALFKVTPGKTFTVQTEAGDVSVLGTKFLVVQQGKKMLVNCEEGSVKVATPVGQRTFGACNRPSTKRNRRSSGRRAVCPDWLWPFSSGVARPDGRRRRVPACPMRRRPERTSVRRRPR